MVAPITVLVMVRTLFEFNLLLGMDVKELGRVCITELDKV